jgi:hypothetical protein
MILYFLSALSTVSLETELVVMCLPGGLSYSWLCHWITWWLFLPLGVLVYYLTVANLRLICYTACNWKVPTKFGHESHIAEQERMYISKCVWKYLIFYLQLKVLKMSSMKFNARLDTSHHGSPHPSKTDSIITDNLARHSQCHGEVPLHCQQELHTQGFWRVSRGTNSEASNLASVQTMQWVLLYLSIGHESCYIELLSQRG